MAYSSTARPAFRVTSSNVPSPLLRYNAWVVLCRRFSCQSALWTKTRSCLPSASASSTGPVVPAGAGGGGRPAEGRGRRRLTVAVRVLVDRLSLQVHLGVQAAVRAGDRLGGLISLEAGVEGFLALLLLLTA